MYIVVKNIGPSNTFDKLKQLIINHTIYTIEEVKGGYRIYFEGEVDVEEELEVLIELQSIIDTLCDCEVQLVQK